MATAIGQTARDAALHLFGDDVRQTGAFSAVTRGLRSETGGVVAQMEPQEASEGILRVGVRHDETTVFWVVKATIPACPRDNDNRLKTIGNMFDVQATGKTASQQQRGMEQLKSRLNALTCEG